MSIAEEATPAHSRIDSRECPYALLLPLADRVDVLDIVIDLSGMTVDERGK